MSRARRARRIAAAAAFGGGGLAGLGVAGLGVLTAEAKMARRSIGRPFGLEGPDPSGVYGAGPGDPVELLMLGDSTAVGLGADTPAHSPGAVIAAGLAQVMHRPVRLTVTAAVGAESRQLDEQIDRALERVAAPEVAVVMVGGNDVTHRVRPSESVRALEGAVRRLRSLGCAVVVGTCPDLGTVEPIAQPLRYVATRLSRELAAAQTIAVVEAGGRTVSLGDLLGPEFRSMPHLMFSADRFHPSSAGYARAAEALLPSVLAALDVGQVEQEQRPDVRLGEGVDDVAHAAARAVAAPGTEVSGGEIAGATRGPRGRWALLLRRRGAVVPDPRPAAPRSGAAVPGARRSGGTAAGAPPTGTAGPGSHGADPAVSSVPGAPGRTAVTGA